jgi:Xaa-Pro aminopeptidase
MSGDLARPDYLRRQNKIVAKASVLDLGSLLISDPVNIRYLTGFTGSNAVVMLPLDAPPVLVTDARYGHQARQECPDCQIVVDRATTKRALQLASERSLKSAGSPRVGFEAGHLTVAAWQSLVDEELAVDLVATTGLVEEVRRRKDQGEITLIEAACSIAETALMNIRGQIRPGRSERDISAELEFEMLASGADDRAFETIVASGPNSAVPHHRPTNRELAVGDLLKIDFGAKLAGYHSDITRTFVIGAEPSDEQLRWHAAVADGAAVARAALRAGVAASKPYQAARQLLDERGLAAAFTHGLGHGVGLKIHEVPIMTATIEATLEADEVVTVEPGVYFPGVGGIRIEDTLLITDEGSRCLTTLPRDLVRLA